MFSLFFSKFVTFCLVLGKLWEARSRLYRRQILQVNTRLRALDEIHTFAPSHPHWKDRLNFVKSLHIFAIVFSTLCSCFAILVQISPLLIFNFSICQLYEKGTNSLDSQNYLRQVTPDQQSKYSLCKYFFRTGNHKWGGLYAATFNSNQDNLLETK